MVIRLFLKVIPNTTQTTINTMSELNNIKDCFKCCLFISEDDLLKNRIKKPDGSHPSHVTMQQRYHSFIYILSSLYGMAIIIQRVFVSRNIL